MTIHFVDVIEEAFERKKLRCAELVEEVRVQGWQAHTRPVEIGVRGYTHTHTHTHTQE